VKGVRRADANHFDVALFQQFAIVGEDTRDFEFFRELRGITGSRRGDCDYFRFIRRALEGYNLDVCEPIIPTFTGPSAMAAPIKMDLLRGLATQLEN
jgi:hypothetical protein